MKRGKLIVFCVIFLALILKASAVYEELVYSGTVKDGESMEIDDRDFYFKVDSNSNKVLVEIDVSGFIIENGACQIKDNYDVCIKNISLSHKNLTTYVYVYQAEVEVYAIKSKLEVTNSLEKENILLDEEAEGVLSLENTADIAAKNVNLNMQIPPELFIISTEGCDRSAGTIVFNGQVSPQQIKECKYKVKGIESGDFDLVGDVAYFDGISSVNDVSNTVSGKVYNFSLKISDDINESKLIGKEFSYEIFIRNVNDEYELTITNLKIRVPEKILVKKKPKEATINGNVMSWSGKLGPEENRTFDMILQGLIAGNFSVDTGGSFRISKFFRDFRHKSYIALECECPFIEYELSPDIMVPGQTTLSVYLTNPSLDSSYSNVNVGYVTSFPSIQDYSTAYSDIKAGQKIKIFDSAVSGLQLGETYHFNVTARYKTKGNQIRTERENIKIPVISGSGGSDAEISENVSLGAEETGEVEEPLDKENESTNAEIIEFEDERKTPIIAYSIAGFVLGLSVLLLLMVKLKKMREKRKMGQYIGEFDEFSKEEL